MLPVSPTRFINSDFFEERLLVALCLHFCVLDIPKPVNIYASAECPPRLEYCRSKNIFWCIEQPSSSLLPMYKPLEARGFQSCHGNPSYHQKLSINRGLE